jgi:hypothetical protein
MKKAVRVVGYVCVVLLICGLARADDGKDYIQMAKDWKMYMLLGGSIICLGGVGAGAALRSVPIQQVSKWGSELITGAFVGLAAVGVAGVVWGLIQRITGVSYQ